jgi:hypothetical protein
MKLFDRIAEKTTRGMLWLILRELRRLNIAIEAGIDSFRAVHGHQPLFPASWNTSNVPRSAVDDGRTLPRGPDPDLAEPDWLRLDILEALCREHHIAITDGLDLFKVAADMGWTDESGQFVVLPSKYGD